jgi:hypothetical protein
MQSLAKLPYSQSWEVFKVFTRWGSDVQFHEEAKPFHLTSKPVFVTRRRRSDMNATRRHVDCLTPSGAEVKKFLELYFGSSRRSPMILLLLLLLLSSSSSSSSFNSQIVMQIDSYSIVASYQEEASCRYTTPWYDEWSPMAQNHGHSQWKKKEY